MDRWGGSAKGIGEYGIFRRENRRRETPGRNPLPCARQDGGDACFRHWGFGMGSPDALGKETAAFDSAGRNIRRVRRRWLSSRFCAKALDSKGQIVYNLRPSIGQPGEIAWLFFI